jgi:hypothetical protein
LITNASPGGLFIALSPPPEVGTHLIVRVRTDEGQRPIVVAGRVVRRVEAPPGAPVPTGVGVEITGSTPEWIATCERLGELPPQDESKP